MPRYYDKINKTEYLVALAGPPTDPNIVTLPPENTFWGEPLASDEELTYDLDGLPDGRQPRTVSDHETIQLLLQGANLTQRRLDKALLFDSRGNPAPLVAFNAELDVLIAANPFTEAQFLEEM